MVSRVLGLVRDIAITTVFGASAATDAFMRFEISTTKGTVIFDQERMNELELHLIGSSPGEAAQGFRRVLVSESYHPYWEHWWPHGHMNRDGILELQR